MKSNWIITRKKFLSDDEVRRLRKVASAASYAALQKGQMLAVRDWMIIDLALSTGLRVSEVSNLRVDDLFIGQGEAELVVTRGKGGKARVVHFDSSLKEHLVEYLNWKQRIGKTGPFVFFSDRRDLMCKEALENVFNKYARKAGITDKSFHSTRHTYAVRLYSRTKDLRLLQKLLGHSTPVITEVYADLLSEDIAMAFETPLY